MLNTFADATADLPVGWERKLNKEGKVIPYCVYLISDIVVLYRMFIICIYCDIIGLYSVVVFDVYGFIVIIR